MPSSNLKSRETGNAENPRLHLVAPGVSEAGKGRPEDASLAGNDVPCGQAGTGDDFAPSVLARAQAGEPDAFHLIFKRYSKPVAAFLYHLTGDCSRAEELTQETFFRTFSRLNRIQEGIKLSTWIFGIARNVAHEALRDVRRSRREIGLRNGLRATLPDERAGPAEQVSGGELRIAIRQALMELSEDQRAVFVLKLLYRMRYQEISAIMGHSVGKLKTDLHRARQLMRTRLQPYVAWKLSEMEGEP